MHCHVHNRKFSPGIVISSCCSPVADEAALAAAEAEVAAADAAAEAEAAALHATNITLNTYPSSSLGIYLA